MSLSAEEREKVLRMFEKLDRGERHRVLASIESFTNWLSRTCWDIFYKIADIISDMWRTLKSFFS